MPLMVDLCFRVLALVLVLVAVLAPPPVKAQQQEADEAHLVLDVNVGSFYVIVDGARDEAQLIASGDTLRLEPGGHNVALAFERAYDHTFFVELEPGSVSTKRVRIQPASHYETIAYLRYSSYPALQLGANLMLRAAPDVDLYVDGEHVGRGTVLLDTLAGTYTVEAVHPEAGRLSRIVTLSDDLRLQVEDLYVRPSRGRVMALSLIPGAAQLAKGKKMRGIALLGATSLLAAASWQRHHSAFEQAASFESQFARLHRAYRNANTQEEALRLGDELEALTRPTRITMQQRDVFAGVAILLYVYSVWDGLRTPKGGYRRTLPRLHPSMWNGQPTISLSMKW